MSSPTWPLDRLLRDATRTVHIAAVCGWAGAVWTGGTPGWFPAAAMLTGAALAALQLRREGPDALRFVSTWAVGAKLGLALAAGLFPAAAGWCLGLALALGGLFSHAPGAVRQAALWGPPGPCATRTSPAPLAEVQRPAA